MKYHGLTPRLLFILLGSLILSGCISEKLAQKPGLLGDLFREEFNCMLPPDIQIAIEERRARYEEVNDIHNINFVLLAENGEMCEQELNRLLKLRWELLRFNKENELELQETKIIYKKFQQKPRRKMGQELCAQYEILRRYHKEYMEKSSYLLEQLAPYKPIILDKFIETWGREGEELMYVDRCLYGLQPEKKN